ncbi:MAG: FprA family A-type flavoprotein [Oscillospiraceae bacterium]
MTVMELKNGVFWNGVLDPNLRVFDIIMQTEFGTTYNSYTVKGSEKTALVETAKLKFYDEYKRSVESITPIDKIDYIIVNHTEPDHSGSLENIIKLNPCAKVVGSAAAINFLKNIVNCEFGSIAVKDGDSISLGDKTLRFLSAPNLHWPDTMYTYIEEDKVLFTCDSFGSHYCYDKVLRSTLSDTDGYLRAAKYYFDNIIGPFKNPFMTNALKKIEPLEIDMICPGHGPVLDSHIDELLKLYRDWCRPEPQHKHKQAVIAYVSAYGYTKQLAQAISQGLESTGEVDVKLFDMSECDFVTVSAELAKSDGFLLGTPTILGEALPPIWALASSMLATVYKGKVASAFGSFGWSGEGVPHIIERLNQLKITVLEGYTVKFKPSSAEIEEAREFGKRFASALLKQSS